MLIVVNRLIMGKDLGKAMRGIDVSKLDPKELLQTRGW